MGLWARGRGCLRLDGGSLLVRMAMEKSTRRLLLYFGVMNVNMIP
jgi:hypothetical protein